MTESVETVVVGAGVVGLAVARALALAGQEVLILEAEPAFGSGISSRNSEVIHAGMYYEPGSLKARLCVAGKARLYAYCAARGVPHSRLGKLIVATAPEQLPGLAAIAARARTNGVEIEPIGPAEAAALEPAVRCAGALLSPSTGIVDSHGLMTALLGDAEAAGAMLALRSPVTGGRVGPAGIEIAVGGGEPMRLACRRLVNAAGLGAVALAGRLAGLDPALLPAFHMAKGCYFMLAGRSPFRRLIYPMPGQAHLGVHVTLDLAGRARFGPDIEWVTAEGYDVDPARADGFYAEIRRYYPDLPDGALQPGYAGIRPKLQAPGGPAVDFVLQGPAAHGIPGLVNLLGIESPGLTSCLAIADAVARMLGNTPAADD
ncbi:MAG: NAD(P)/FAD-dependent oxidoreductase [Dongiaceae bacterium]